MRWRVNSLITVVEDILIIVNLYYIRIAIELGFKNQDLDDPVLYEENDETKDEVEDLTQSLHLIMGEEENSETAKEAEIVAIKQERKRTLLNKIKLIVCFLVKKKCLKISKLEIRYYYMFLALIQVQPRLKRSYL